jgi:uncharacterized protein (DUF362 family)
MKSTVAVIKIAGNPSGALREGIRLVGGIEGLNSPERDVTIKVGIFDPRSRHHTSAETVQAIIDVFDKAPCIRLAESDNYCGGAMARLNTCYGTLFNERVTPHNLSDDPLGRTVNAGGEEMHLSEALFPPNILISTHILRTFARGSILKNLFGCTPMVQKARHHKTEVFNSLLADIAEAAGGIDLAVMDGSKLYHSATEKCIDMDVLIVGRDAAAVETVGAALAGLKPEKMAFLQEFARRGMGKGALEEIEIVGITMAEFETLRKAHRALKKLVDAAPRMPGISDTIDLLTEEGWMDTPRSTAEVLEALHERGVKNAKAAVVETTLKRRNGKTLERRKAEDGDGKGWVYQRKAG